MVEIIPKQTVKYSLRAYIFFYVVLAFFSVSAVGFFVIQQLTSLQQDELTNLEQHLRQITTSEEEDLKEGVLDSKIKIEDFARIVAKRQNTNKPLSFLENYTHPEVVFSSFSYVAQTRTVQLAGVGTSFFILEQQMLALENLPDISELTLSGVALSNSGRASFGLEIIFTEAALEQIFITEAETLSDEGNNLPTDAENEGQ